MYPINDQLVYFSTTQRKRLPTHQIDGIRRLKTMQTVQLSEPTILSDALDTALEFQVVIMSLERRVIERIIIEDLLKSKV